MTEKKRSIYIFHLYRREKDFILLHPFSTPEKLISLLETCEIKGRYGEEPRVETFTYLKNELYRMIDTGVNNWIADIRFIPRFILSSVSFLAAFFFFSFVVIDPIPLVDELGFSLIIAIIVYILLGRLDTKSDQAARRKISLKTAVDRILFLPSEFVKKLEQDLQQNESGDFEDVFKSISSPANRAEFNAEEPAGELEEVKYFVLAFEATFNLHHVKKDEKKLKKYFESATKKDVIQDIKKWTEQKKIDFPLYALYKKCKQQVIGLR